MAHSRADSKKNATPTAPLRVYDPVTDSLPSHDRDAERAILGAILRDNDVLPAVSKQLIASDFYFDAHQKIYQALCDLRDEGQPIDLVLLHDKLRKNKQLDDVGAGYLPELLEAISTAANALHHLDLVREWATLRHVRRIANEMIRDACDPVGPADAVVARAQGKLSELELRCAGTQKLRAYSPRLFTSEEFFAAEFPREFLVRNVLVKGEPAVLGGVKKTLKSAVGTALAIALDTATPFLGYERFAVPRRANVMLLNGESGNATVQETAARIARANGIDPRSLRIVWGADLPQLANVEHLRDLADVIRARHIEVLIVDPAYLCLLSGVPANGAQASNLFDMGPIYLQFARFCLEAGATPILAIHAKKGRGNEPLDLDDLTFAGVAEFARQWLLLSRRKDYEGDGLHQLWLNIGGSSGHSFVGHLDINEGVIDEEFGGRTWAAAVESCREAARVEKADRDSAKLEQRQADDRAVMVLIDRLAADSEVATLNRIRNGSGLSRARTDAALERLRLERVIEPYRATVPKGNNATQEAEGYRRKPDSL